MGLPPPRAVLTLLGKIFCWNPGNPNGGANPIGEDFLFQFGKPWVVLILSGGGLLTGGSGHISCLQYIYIERCHFLQSPSPLSQEKQINKKWAISQPNTPSAFLFSLIHVIAPGAGVYRKGGSYLRASFSTQA